MTKPTGFPSQTKYELTLPYHGKGNSGENPRAVFKTQDLFVPSSVVLWGPYHSFLRQVIDLNQEVQMRMTRGVRCCFLAYKMLNTRRTRVV